MRVARDLEEARVLRVPRNGRVKRVFLSPKRESRRRENIEKLNLKINLTGLKYTTFNK